MTLGELVPSTMDVVALGKLVPSTMVVVEPKVKKKYKTKEKEEDVIVENLIALGQTMIGEQVHDEEVQSIQNMVEEVAKASPWKTKKKTMKRKYEAGPSKAKAHEKTPSPLFEKREKRGVWALWHKPMAPK